MKPSVRVHPAAEEELAAAFDWYEAKHSGLGRAFLLAIDTAFVAVAEQPEAWPVWPRLPHVRRYVVHRFPFVVFYRVVDAEVVIMAVAHAKRRPGCWRERA